MEKAQASGGTGGIYAQQTYTYDQLGNLTNNGNGTLTYGTQSAAPTCPDGALTKPHAVVSGNGNTYCYDANGNQVKRILGANTLTLTYDTENRLTTVSGATSASFVYDGDGNRVKSVVNGVTTYHIGNHFEWRSTAGNMGRYYYADGQRIAMRYGSTVYYLLGDHLGSTTLTVTGSGAKYAEQRYLPYGGTRSGSMPTDRQFTGQRREASLGFYDYVARQFDPVLGRFLQADTIIPDPANPQSLNRYSYTLGNPLKYIDPSGHKACLDTDCTQFENTAAFMRESKRPNFIVPPMAPSQITVTPKNGFGNTYFAFQQRYEMYRNIGGLHSGIDIGAPNGTRLVAMDHGTVVCAGDGCFMGIGNNGIAIKTGNFIIIYGHVRGIKVSSGDVVYPGTEIAEVGDGHLHLEVREIARLAKPENRHDKFRNPLYFFMPFVLREMSLTWQSYVDQQGQLSVDYNEWTMISYERPGNWFDGTLKNVTWKQ